MDAPESAPADTLALPDAPPAITLGQALPFALAFEARRRQAADRRAARKLQRLKDTLRQCGELRARLAALCDAATAAAASGDDGEDARDGRIGANAARELMLVAARGASRALGEPHEGKHAASLEEEVFATEKTSASPATGATGTAPPRVSRLRCVACGARASEASEAFAFVREARAFRLAELALADRFNTDRSITDRPAPASLNPPGGSAPPNAASRPRFGRVAPTSLNPSRAYAAILRGADDPPASFAAGTYLLELAGASPHDSDDTATNITQDRRETAKTHLSRKEPPLPFGLAGAARAKEAKRRVAVAARSFATALEIERTEPFPVASRHENVSAAFFRRDTAHAHSSDALRRDVLAALVAEAAPSVKTRPETETDFFSFFGGAAAGAPKAAVASAGLARVALVEAADTDALAGDTLMLCASRIREGVVALRERRFTDAARLTGEPPAEPAAAGFIHRVEEDRRAGETESRDGSVVGESREPDRTPFGASARASRTLDEFGECQRLGFVFSVSERAARRLRASARRYRSAAETDASSSGFEPRAFLRAALDAARAAAEAATAPDHAIGNARASEPPESVAVRLVCSRAIRLHAMVRVALGEKAPETRA